MGFKDRLDWADAAVPVVASIGFVVKEHITAPDAIVRLFRRLYRACQGSCCGRRRPPHVVGPPELSMLT